jgi:UDP-N-acetylmuramoyl-tripeptide--D-alanyl-D-alanine ligase
MGELGLESPQAHLDVGRQVAATGLDQLLAVGYRAGGIAAGAREGGFENVTEIPEVEAAARWIKDFARSGDLILIKASRSMRFERLTAALREGFGAPGGAV